MRDLNQAGFSIGQVQSFLPKFYDFLMGPTLRQQNTHNLADLHIVWLPQKYFEKLESIYNFCTVLLLLKVVPPHISTEVKNTGLILTINPIGFLFKKE